MKEDDNKSTENSLDQHKINYTIQSMDIEINGGNIGNNTLDETRRLDNKIFYRTLEDIYGYLDHLAGTYERFCHVTTIGTSYENRPIKMVRLSSGQLIGQTILVDAGMFGRDWSAVASALYFIERFLFNFDNILPLVRSKTWLIIPVLNPDGYVFSMRRDNLWQKNRHPSSNGDCHGVNIDSNIDFYGCINPEFKRECHPLYCGSGPFSEPEARAFRDVVKSIHIAWYISIRSGGAKVLFPSAGETAPSPGGVGNMYDEVSSSNAYHTALAKDMAMVMSMHGVKYTAEKASPYNSTPGSSLYWMSRQQTDAAIMIGTRGDSPVLPEEQLQLVCTEVYAGLTRFARMV